MNAGSQGTGTAPSLQGGERVAQPAVPPRALHLLVILGIAVVTAGIYAPTLGFGFLQLDDDRYVTENPWVQQGLSRESLSWAATAQVPSNWHPLTLISYMVDVELWGLEPAGYHAENLAWHVLNALLLLWGLRRLTGRFWPSACVAALFAWHPLHVESVAWISERKDVLSTTFGLLALGAYAAYARHGGIARHLLVALFLGIGLAAKPMLVTWPFALLLLDVWPLQRLRFPGMTPAVGAARAPACSVRPAGWLILEKLPLLLLSAAAAALTLAAQGRALGVAAGVPWPQRFANALVSIPRYLGKTLWPEDLSILYPHPYLPGGEPWSGAAVVGAALVIVAISLLAWRLRSRPYFAVGWLWFLGTLVPVSGVVQVGFQAMADRYTYVPHVGLFVALAWGAADVYGALRERSGVAAGALVALLLAALAGSALRAAEQVGAWSDDLTLVRRSVAATPDSVRLRYKLGAILLQQGAARDARIHLEEAHRLWPEWEPPAQDLAWLLATAGDPALRDLERAIELAQGLAERSHFRDANTLDTLAAAYAAAGDWPRAQATAQRALELARAGGEPRLARDVERRLRLYEEGRANLETGAESGAP
jgi:tetratricopeptide (TPR) repeat protein